MNKKQIKDSLVDQLSCRGLESDHFIDMVNDYISMWQVKNFLIKDIKTRGVTFLDNSHLGTKMQKNNPSVKELVMINKQMLSVLKELGLNAATMGGDYSGAKEM